MRKRGASRSPRFAPDVRTFSRTRGAPHCRRCVWSYESRTPPSPCPPGASRHRVSAPSARIRHLLLRKRACTPPLHACWTSVAARCRSSSASRRPIVLSSTARRTRSQVSARARRAFSNAPSEPHPTVFRRITSFAASLLPTTVTSSAMTVPSASTIAQFGVIASPLPAFKL